MCFSLQAITFTVCLLFLIDSNPLPGTLIPSTIESIFSNYILPQVGHPVLRQVVARVPPEKISSPAIQDVIQTLRKALIAKPGYGLAAPQLGINWQIAIIQVTEQDILASGGGHVVDELGMEVVPLQVLINPVITPIGKLKEIHREGCLSVEHFTANVARWKEVKVSALNEHGTPVSWIARRWLARIVQHEYDFLF